MYIVDGTRYIWCLYCTVHVVTPVNLRRTMCNVRLYVLLISGVMYVLYLLNRLKCLIYRFNVSLHSYQLTITLCSSSK